MFFLMGNPFANLFNRSGKEEVVKAPLVAPPTEEPAAETEEAVPGPRALGTAVEAIGAQATAASALRKASDALADEEEALATTLGLDDLEELENALGALDGIGEHGTELNVSDAREARTRSAHLEWCQEYKGGTAEEGRFATFSG